MKKYILMLVAIAAFGSATQAQAQTTPPATAAAAKPATAQQSRMSTCAKQYHEKNIPKSQYHQFISQCLKSKPMGTGSGTGAGSNNAPKLPAQQ